MYGSREEQRQTPKVCNEVGLVPTVYLTKEQIYRLVQFAQDSLVGVQIHTDASDETYLTCEWCRIDSTVDMEYAKVYADGSWVNQT